MLLVFVIFSISVTVFLYRRRKRLPTNLPVLGMTPDILLNMHQIHDFVTNFLKLSDGTFLLKGPWFANIDMLITSNPANINHILSKNFPNYPKGPDFRNIFDILGDGIFNSDNELWEIHRKTTNMYLFKHEDFHSLLEQHVMNKVENGLLPVLDSVSLHDKETDLQDVFQRITFDVICLLLLDCDPESLSVDLPSIPFEKAFIDAEEALLWRHFLPEKVWKLQRKFGLGKEKKMSEAWKSLDEFIYKSLSLKKVNDESVLLASMMKGFEGQNGSSGDSKKFLKDVMFNLMLAGRDTTSAALSWFFYLLTQNPSAETKIREEIENKLGGQKWNTLDVKDLGELKYLHGGICEALRLYPPVGLEHKAPTKADVLPSGHVVDENSRIILSFYSMGRMEGLWGKDCMEFKPERWILQGGGIKHEPSYKFPAFHAGPRACLGKEMAMIQIKMVAIAVVCHYHVELVDGHKVCPSDSIILQMRHGLKVKVFPVNINKT